MDGRLSYITRLAFLEERQKIATPRWVKEMRRTGDFDPSQFEGAPLGPVGKRISKANIPGFQRRALTKGKSGHFGTVSPILFQSRHGGAAAAKTQKVGRDAWGHAGDFDPKGEGETLRRAKEMVREDPYVSKRIDVPEPLKVEKGGERTLTTKALVPGGKEVVDVNDPLIKRRMARDPRFASAVKGTQLAVGERILKVKGPKPGEKWDRTYNRNVVGTTRQGKRIGGRAKWSPRRLVMQGGDVRTGKYSPAYQRGLGDAKAQPATGYTTQKGARVFEALERVAEKGLEHPDPHGANVGYVTSKGKPRDKAFVMDWGLKRERTPGPLDRYEREHMRKMIAGVGAGPTGKNTLYQYLEKGKRGGGDRRVPPVIKTPEQVKIKRPVPETLRGLTDKEMRRGVEPTKIKTPEQAKIKRRVPETLRGVTADEIRWLKKRKDAEILSKGKKRLAEVDYGIKKRKDAEILSKGKTADERSILAGRREAALARREAAVQDLVRRKVEVVPKGSNIGRRLKYLKKNLKYLMK